MCSAQITSYEIIRTSLFGKFLMTETSDTLKKNAFSTQKDASLIKDETIYFKV